MAPLTKTERLRRSHKPDDVRVVFIGESPPVGGTFFYTEDSLLYCATRAAFRGAIPELRRQSPFLEAFQQLGCYVDDLSAEPVNELPINSPQRKKARRDGAIALAERISDYSPREVVVVMRAIRHDARRALAHAGYSDVPCHELRFPARHYNDYVRDLSELIRGWRRRRVLLPL